MKEKNFKFRESYAIAIKAMNDKEAGQFIKAICNYVFETKVPVTNNRSLKSNFNLAKITLDEEIRNVENGRMGGLKRIQNMLKASEGSTAITIEMNEKNCPMSDVCKAIFMEESLNEKTDCGSKNVVKTSKKQAG